MVRRRYNVGIDKCHLLIPYTSQRPHPILQQLIAYFQRPTALRAHRKGVDRHLIRQETLLVILVHLGLRDGKQPGLHFWGQLLLEKVLFQQIVRVRFRLQVAAFPFFNPLHGLPQQFGQGVSVEVFKFDEVLVEQIVPAGIQGGVNPAQLQFRGADIIGEMGVKPVVVIEQAFVNSERRGLGVRHKSDARVYR